MADASAPSSSGSSKVFVASSGQAFLYGLVAVGVILLLYQFAPGAATAVVALVLLALLLGRIDSISALLEGR